MGINQCQALLKKMLHLDDEAVLKGLKFLIAACDRGYLEKLQHDSRVKFT